MFPLEIIHLALDIYVYSILIITHLFIQGGLVLTSGSSVGQVSLAGNASISSSLSTAAATFAGNKRARTLATVSLGQIPTVSNNFLELLSVELSKCTKQVYESMTTSAMREKPSSFQ